MDLLFIQDEEEKTIAMKKESRCGGWIGCPFRLSVLSDGAYVGHVKENFTPYCSKCFECCFCCSFYHHVHVQAAENAPVTNRMDRDGGDPKYELKLHLCCCQGGNNNFCAATCFNHNGIYEIRDPTSGAVVGNFQKLFAPSTSNTGTACCRMLFAFDTFAIEFPRESTQIERLMLIAGIMQAEFQLFEQDQDG